MTYRSKRIARPRVNTNATWSTRLAERFDRPDAPVLGIRRVWTQASQDLFGTKDVQDAITASYVWLADQIGHVTLGLVPTLLLCWLISAYTERGGWQVAWFILGGGAVWAVWAYKEYVDFVETKARAKKVFTFDDADVLWNVKTALLYFGIGGTFAVAAFCACWWVPVALAVLLYPALAVGFWWLRRKLAFQQAGLPYLYRLANFSCGMKPLDVDNVGALANMTNRQVAFWRVLLGIDPVPDQVVARRHVLVTGKLGTGKTSLVVGIGTEYAFALGIGRYLSAAKLVQLATEGPCADGKLEYYDGRYLWPWRDCDLLIVDDVDAGAARPGDAVQATCLVQPSDLVGALCIHGDTKPLAWLADKKSAWVIGDPSGALAWRRAIAGLMGITPDEILIVELTDGSEVTVPVRRAA